MNGASVNPDPLVMCASGRSMQKLATGAAANAKPDRFCLSGMVVTRRQRVRGLFGHGGLERSDGNAGALIRIVGVRDIFLQHAMGIEE